MRWGSREAVVTAQAWRRLVLTPWLGTLTAVFRACEFLRSLVVHPDLSLLGEGAGSAVSRRGGGCGEPRGRTGGLWGRGGRVQGAAPGGSRAAELVSLSQVFKFIYCCRLAEMGLAAQAFHYCEAIARSVLAQPHRHSPVLLRQLVQVMPPAWGPQGPQPRGAQTARPRRAQPCGAQTARPRRALHTLGQEQVFAPQHRALGSFGVRRAAGRRPAYLGTLASHLAPGASLGWVLAVAPQPQLPAP